MKTTITKASALLALLVTMVNGAMAGNWTNFSNYTEATSVAQRGNEIWVSDKSGLLMYNSFTGTKTFFKKSPTELPSLTVERIRVHPQTNDIWIGTYDNGLAMLHNNTWTHIPFPSIDAMLYEMKIGADGTVWSATSEGIYRYQNGSFTHYLGSGNDAAWDIDLLPNGKILCGSNMPFLFDPATQIIQNIPSTVFAYGFSRVVAENDHHFFFSSDHNELAEFTDTIQTDTNEIDYALDMQINSSGHLMLLDQQKVLHERTGGLFYNTTFGNNSLHAFLATASGEIWGAGSEPDNALFHQNTQLQNEQIDISKCGLNSNWVSYVSNTSDGNILLVSSDGLQKFDLGTQGFTTIPVDSLMPGNINEVIEANGKMYAGTSYRYLYENSGTGWVQRGNGILPDHEVKHLDTDAQGNVWMCGYGFIAKYDGSNFSVYDVSYNSHLNQYIRDIHCDRARNVVWFCSYDGVFKLDNNTVSFYNDSTPGIQLYYDAVETIEEDADHNIWFGTVYGGILKYDGNTFSTMILPQTVGNQFITDIAFTGGIMYVSDNLNGVWKYENAEWDSLNMGNSGIADNMVSGLNVDTRGNLWMSHLGHGVDVYNKNGVSLSVQEVKNSLAAAVYPNPNTGKFALQWGNDENADISIFSTDGKLVRFLSNVSNKVIIDLSDAGNGLYLAEVKTSTGVQRIKVVVR